MFLALSTSVDAAPRNVLPLGKGWTITSRASGNLVPGGSKETVVILRYECPNANICGNQSSSEVVVTRGRLLTRVATLSAMSAPLKVSVSGKEILVSGLEYADGDARCCPSVGFFRTYEYSNGRFESTGGGDS